MSLPHPTHVAAPSTEIALSARADRDLLSIFTWIASKQASQQSPNTIRALRIEALRWLAWVVWVKGISPSGTWLDQAQSIDAAAYATFLASPKPCPLPVPVLQAAGLVEQPFRSRALKKTSIDRAISMLRTMYDDLPDMVITNGTQVTRNPFARLKFKGIDLRKSEPRKKALTSRERDLVNAALATWKDDGDWATYHQFRWIWSALVLTALRRSELANAHEGHIYIEEDENQLEGWMMEVLGKGGVAKSIPLTDEFMVEFAAYREYHGLPATPVTHAKGPDELIPLVVPRRGAMRKVNDALIYRAIKAILARAEQLAVASGNHASANRLRHFSTHSTRHTGVTMIVDATGDITLGMEMARHESISTTQRYKQKSTGRLRQAMQRSVTAGSSQD